MFDLLSDIVADYPEEIDHDKGSTVAAAFRVEAKYLEAGK